MSQLLSKEFVILFGGEVIARCVDFEFEINKQVIDLTTLDSGQWREILADQKEWRITFNALIARSGTRNYDAMLENIKDDDDPVTVAIGGRQDGTAIEQGEAVLTQLRFSARVGERAAYNGTIEGTGELITTTMPAFAADFLTFTVPGQEGTTTISTEAKTVAINVPFATDVTELVATWTTSPSVIKTLVGTKHQESGVTVNDFSSPVVYKIYAGNTTLVNEYTVTVTVLPDPEE